MPQAFKLYRIICTITDKALVSGSDCPHHHLAKVGGHGRYKGAWYERGSWSSTGGAFWKTEWTVKKHLQNLCHDWTTKHSPEKYPRYLGETHYWREVIPGPPDWSRLNDLSVEELLITKYSTVRLAASDFMGIATQNAA